MKNVAFCLAVALTYFILGLQYEGPAYLADEIGYLSNAAFIAGHPSDGASSYYAGYSLIISPLFYVFTDPHHVWMGTIAINSLMWGATFFWVSLLLRMYQPAVAEWKFWLALLVVASYPAYLTMGGYAFSQTAFAFVFTSAAFALTYIDTKKVWSVLPHAFLVGYLCWIHPVGLAVGVASSVSLLAISWRSKRFAVPAVSTVVIALSVAAYIGWVRPWMIEQMTPVEGGANLHYQDISKLVRDGISLDQLKILSGVIVGQFSYLIIATFGFLATGAAWLMRDVLRCWTGLDASAFDEALCRRAAISLFLVLAIPGIIGETALAFLVGHPNRLDHWIYGRYVEPVIAVLLGLGVLVPASRAVVLASAAFVALSGAWLVHGLGISGEVYAMNVPAWWPEFTGLSSSVISCFVLGGIGVIAIALFNRALSGALVIIAFLFCADIQQDWHQNIISTYSKPSTIPQFVEANYGENSCVGFDVHSADKLTLAHQERANLYSFYLFSSPMIRTTPERWLHQCAGPLLTFNPNLDLPGIEYVGRETASHLFVVVKKREGDLNFPEDNSGGQYWREGQSESCLLAGCFHVEGRQLLTFSQVGKASKQDMETNGQAGYLLYGPYVSLAEGTYILEMKGDFKSIEGAKLDIVSNRAREVHFRSSLSAVVSPDRKSARIRFKVRDQAKLVEVRVLVSEKDEVRLDSYEVKLTDPKALDAYGVLSLESSSSDVVYSLSDQAELPRQVGVADEFGIHSDGRRGFLFYGPYRKAVAGSYALKVLGSSGNATESWIDIASEGGKRSHGRFPIRAEVLGPKLVLAEVVIDKDVDDLEVRAFVGAGDLITVESYSLTLAPDGN